MDFYQQHLLSVSLDDDEKIINEVVDILIQAVVQINFINPPGLHDKRGK